MIPEMKKTFSRVKDKLAEKVIRQQVVTRIGNGSTTESPRFWRC